MSKRGRAVESRRHEHDPARDSQPNRWFGMDTCACKCGCGFVALGLFFDDPLCSHCKANEPDWNRPDSSS